MTHCGKKGLTFVSLLLVAVLAFTIGTAVISTSAQSQTIMWPSTTPQPPNAAGAVLQSDTTYSNIYNQVGPSVVSINVVATQNGSSGSLIPGNQDQGQVIEGTGTGFVIDTNGD